MLWRIFFPHSLSLSFSVASSSLLSSPPFSPCLCPCLSPPSISSFLHYLLPPSLPLPSHPASLLFPSPPLPLPPCHPLTLPPFLSPLSSTSEFHSSLYHHNVLITGLYYIPIITHLLLCVPLGLCKPKDSIQNRWHWYLDHLCTII